AVGGLARGVGFVGAAAGLALAPLRLLSSSLKQLPTGTAAANTLRNAVLRLGQAATTAGAAARQMANDFATGLGRVGANLGTSGRGLAQIGLGFGQIGTAAGLAFSRGLIASARASGVG